MIFPALDFSLSKSDIAATIPRLRRPLDYNDLSRVDSVTTTTIAGAPLKFVSHRDIPSGELHMVLDNRCVGKIINIE